MPLVPVVIRGTRSILRSGSWFPHRGRVYIRFGEPIQAEGADWRDAIELRNAAREQMLLHLGEPDLAGERTPL